MSCLVDGMLNEMFSEAVFLNMKKTCHKHMTDQKFPPKLFQNQLKLRETFQWKKYITKRASKTINQGRKGSWTELNEVNWIERRHLANVPRTGLNELSNQAGD